MGDVSLEISIPLDNDGFIEMECDFCKNRFMLHEEVYKDDDYLHFFCPICGFPNRINTFYCTEVLEKAQQQAMNYAYMEIERQLGKSINKINRGGFLKMSLKMPSKEAEVELYEPSYDYKRIHLECCDVDVKSTDFDEEIGLYCPLCGGTHL